MLSGIEIFNFLFLTTLKGNSLKLKPYALKVLSLETIFFPAEKEIKTAA